MALGTPGDPPRPDLLGCCTPGPQLWEAEIHKEESDCARLEEGSSPVLPLAVQQHFPGPLPGAGIKLLE